MSEVELKDTSLNEIAEFRNGKGLSSTFYNIHGKYPVFGANGQFARTNEVLNPNPVIVIGRVGAYCGSLYFINGPSWVTDNAIISIPKETINARFLFYLLKTLDIRRMAIGSAQPLITQEGLKKINVKIPPPSIQNIIAQILGSIDSKIELNQQMNETLDAMALAIFKSWFIDFDPVRTKMGGWQPSGIDAEVASLFPSEFNEVEGREIPNGWKVSPLSAIIDLIGGGTPKTTTEEYWNGTIPWFSVVDAPNESDVYVISTEKSITNAGLENSSTNILPVGTTIISARGTVGKLALAGIPITINQSCYGIRGINGYPDYFIYYLLRIIVSDLKRKTHGTVFETITRQTFDTVNIIVPPVNIAQQFDNFVKTHNEKILNNLFESQILEQIRDTLLPRLISGNLRIQQEIGGLE